MTEHGSIAGNRARGSAVRVTNRHRFSYPGYAEILVGEAHDDVIDSNDKRRNPYPTVLEFLKGKLGLDKRQVAAFASWDTFDWIVGFLAVVLGSANVVGGFVVTDRMLEMFKKREPAAERPVRDSGQVEEALGSREIPPTSDSTT